MKKGGEKEVEKRWTEKKRLHAENREGKKWRKSWGIAREVEWKEWKREGKKEVEKVDSSKAGGEVEWFWNEVVKFNGSPKVKDLDPYPTYVTVYIFMTLLFGGL